MDNLLWYHLGKKHGGGGGGSSGGGGETGPVLDVLLDKTIANFASDSNWGGIYTATRMYGVDGFEAFEMTEGENYTVVWDGIEHKVTARNVPGMAGFLLVGNGDLVGLPSKGELFAIAWSNDTVVFFSLEAKASHDVRIYKTVIENAEAPSVALDFTNGDQIIRPSEDGKALDEVVVLKPENLVPANIPKDMYIAGIGPGEFEGGGGGGSAKIAWGTLAAPTGVSEKKTITHGLGVMPDMILIDTIANATGSSTANPHNMLAFSSAFKSATGMARQTRNTVRGNSTNTRNFSTSIMTDGNPNYMIGLTNEETFVAANLDPQQTGGYFWIAIAGLT